MRSPASGDIGVSVILATYNHAPFIERAIDSVLSQRTDRRFELIISEDASTDGTRAIVEAAARRDKRVRLILSDVNLRSNEVVARGLRVAGGRYVCLLDGDDHWIVPDKIERQAALLDQEEHASACFHNALIIRGDDAEPGRERWTPATQQTRSNLRDIWRGNAFATSGGMMRRAALARLGDWYAGFFPITDWPLYILCAEQGELLFVDQAVAAYRLHRGGSFSALPGTSKLDLTSRFYRDMDRATQRRCHAEAQIGGTHYFLEWAEVYASASDGRMARACLWRSLRAGGVGRSSTLLSRWGRAAVKSIT
jgi:glycosyltransferase involved in cell wall biosynthesis